MNGSEYGNIPYEVDEITSFLDTWLNDNMPGLLEGILLAYDSMSPSLFLDGIVTGTVVNKERINDGATDEYADFTDVGRYLEVDFGLPRYIRQYRFYRSTIDNDVPHIKIEYWDDDAWVEWIVGVPHWASGWSPWYIGELIVTTKIRMETIATGTYRLTECQMKV